MNNYSQGIVVGIDASRNRSGGAKAHLRGVLKDTDPREYGISRIHVWSYTALLDSLPEEPWVVKHRPQQLEGLLLQQVLWQYFQLPNEVRRTGCDILLNTDAGTICGFRPAVVMSRDMLSYEPCEMRRFGFSLARLRLIALRFIQTRSMRNARGVIFLTNYAANIIQRATGKLPRSAIIPHGVDIAFRSEIAPRQCSHDSRQTIKCLYVSNITMYKHQWMVVRAVGELRKRGFNISLFLAGGATKRARKLLDQEIARTDPAGNFVNILGHVPYDRIPALLSNSDIVIFASSCENMPNTLIEAMAGGLPIASSDRGPMPEILKDGGVYFDPERSNSIATAIEKLISDSKLRMSIAKRARELSEEYSWQRCGAETWEFLKAVVKR